MYAYEVYTSKMHICPQMPLCRTISTYFLDMYLLWAYIRIGRHTTVLRWCVMVTQKGQTPDQKLGRNARPVSGSGAR